MKSRDRALQIQNKKIRLHIIALAVLSLFIFPELAVYSAPTISENGSYLFSEQLSSSVTWLRSGADSEEVTGTWTKDRFLFKGLSSNAEIRATKNRRDDGRVQTAIRFNSIENVKRILEFSDVPSGSKLKVSYGVLSERAKDEKVSYLNFRIWIGQKKVSELRFQNSPGWNDVHVPLGIYSFLNRKGVFRIELFSDASNPVLFDFDIELI